MLHGCVSRSCVAKDGCWQQGCCVPGDRAGQSAAPPPLWQQMCVQHRAPVERGLGVLGGDTEVHPWGFETDCKKMFETDSKKLLHLQTLSHS